MEGEAYLKFKCCAFFIWLAFLGLADTYAEKYSEVQNRKAYETLSRKKDISLVENAKGIYSPLWTPKDVVTFPFVDGVDVSSNGKYTLMEVVYSSLKEKEATQLLQCFLVNNENLKKEIIGTVEQGCSQPQFIENTNAFAYLIENKDGNSFLFTKDTLTGNVTKVLSLQEGLRSYAFAPDGKSFVYTQVEKPENEDPRIVEGGEDEKKVKLYLQKLDQHLKPIGNPEPLTPTPLVKYSPYSPSYTWFPDSTKIVLTSSKTTWKSEAYTSVNIIDINTKKMDTIFEGYFGVQNLCFSPDGKQLAFLKTPTSGIQTMGIRALKEDPSMTIQLIDLKTRKERKIPVADIFEVVGWMQDREELIVIKREGTKCQLNSLNLQTEHATRMEVPHVSCITNAALSKNQNYIGLIGENLHYPGEVYISALDHFVPKKISAINKKIDLSSIPATSLKWKSFDGEEIEGILVYPQNYKKGQKVPLIVSIHGGPAGVSIEEFIGQRWLGNYSPAVFASLGYATLTVNYRGGIGYGVKFQHLDYQDMGGVDFKDIIAGVDHIIAKGIADPEKLYIYGHSYGGFMTAWAIGHTHRFKAAVVSAGIVDWISDIAVTDYPTTMESVFGGYYWDNYELWRKTSPINYVNNITTPTLILHGLKDVRVPITQARQFHQILQEHRVPSRAVYYFNEGHSFDGLAAIVDTLNESIEWFKKYEK